MISAAAEIEGEIQLGRFALGGNRFDGQALEVVESRLRQLDELQHHLHQRVAAGVTGQVERLHHLLKGELLVVVGRQRRGFDLLQQLPEALLRGKASADRQRVDKEADQGFEIGMVTTPDRNTNRKILLAAVAMEQQGQ